MNCVKVAKWGNSLAVRIPRALSNDLDIKEGSDVELIVRDGELVICPRRLGEYDIDDLINGISAKNMHSLEDWGAPVGGEVW